MKQIKFLDSKGFTLVEMMIAAGIMVVVTLGGYSAYQYFNTQTVKEAKKMDDISEFNALTKDLISFTEGGGISTLYLNTPIKTTGCNDSEPCVRQLVGQNFVTPSGSLPSALSGNACMQFYKDSKAALSSKAAYPGRPQYADKIWSFADLDMSTSQDLFATWIIKDNTSPPFTMVKSRDASIYLKILTGSLVLKSRMNGDNESVYQNIHHSFYESSTDPDALKKLQGYPFLIYSAVYPGQYVIQYAEQVVACKDDRAACVTLLHQANPTGAFPTSDADFSSQLGNTDFPDKVFAIKFKEIDFNDAFFKETFDRQQLPSNCVSAWGDGRQASGGYFFPSSVMSVTPDPTDATKEIGSFPLNTFYLPKYPVTRSITTSNGAYVALPIDIITYRAEAVPNTTTFQLVSQLWHPTEIKKKIKIQTLKVPFIISRKLGSPEMGIWYNPIKKNQ